MKTLNKSFVKLMLIPLLLFAMNSVLLSQNVNRPSPPGFFQYEFQALANYNTHYFSFGLFNLLYPLGSPNYRPPSLALYDPQGYLLWYQQADSVLSFADFKYNQQRQLFTKIDFYSPEDVDFVVMDAALNPLRKLKTVAGIMADAHEFIINSAGNYVLSGMKDSIFDLSNYSFNGNPGSDSTHVRCFIIQELDSANNLLWQWNSCDHIHPSEGDDFYGYSSSIYDYCHGNSIEEDFDGNYLVSFRHMNAICKISRLNGGVMWQLGGKSNQFTFLNDSGFSGQHDVRRQPNGNISMFDNANLDPNQISRALEYTLNTTDMTASKAWEYIASPSFFADAMGNVQILDSVKMITYGRVGRPDLSATLLDFNDSPLANFLFEDKVVSYRGFAFNPVFAFPRPEITCSVDIDGLRLHAPAGKASYIWSNGDTTSSIHALPSTTYQVWIPYAEGMLGSLPYKSWDAACPPVGVSEHPKSRPPRLLSVVDLYGREVSQRERFHVYVEIYSDGSRRKILYLGD